MNQEKQDQSLAEKFQRIEDRLILASLPTLLIALIVWAVGSAFPFIGTVTNLTITIMAILVFFVVAIRLGQVAWAWAIFLKNLGPETEGEVFVPYFFGLIGIGILSIGGLVELVDMVTHAGKANDSRAWIIAVLIVILVIQYRAIIVRYLKK